MEKNMSVIDRGLRIVLAVVLGYLIMNGTLIGIWAWVLGILAVIFLLTSILGHCFVYKVVGMSTAKEGTEGGTES
ncbi:MAG: DUF2892 domain-containing protein [Candidatus Neomarinimicrobiota bacterium]